jgi:hypothetical protein
MWPSVTAKGRSAWTRRVALDAWNRSIGTLSLVATGAIALGAAFRGFSDTWDEALIGVGLVAVLPALWVGLTRLAERRYFSRPPKRFLATVLGFDLGGIAFVAAAVLMLQSDVETAPLLTAGGLLEGCGTLLVLAWFTGVLAVAPGREHMHPL